MPTQKLVLKPGVNTQLSQTLNTKGIYSSNLIRFRSGLPEKLGGWQRISNQNTVGTVRFMHAWASLTGAVFLAFGSDQRLQVLQGGAITDITPFRRTINVANVLATTSGSSIVTVTDAGGQPLVGDWVQFPVYASIGGLVIFGFYIVTAVVSPTMWQFDAGTAATATVAAGGTVPQFTTVSGSANVTVTLPNHGFTSAQVFTVYAPTTVGGVTFSGPYVIVSITDANHFVIAVTPAATGSASAFENAGNVQVDYLLPSASPASVPISGWGAGAWGSGTWGITSGSTAEGPLRNWSLENFGQNLEAVPTNGMLYEWVPGLTTPPLNPAVVVANAPTVNWAMFIGMPQEQVILVGSSVGGVQDPLLVAWSDAGINTVWAATATNQAGSFRLSRGSQIVNGLQAPHTALIWTDIDLWSMTYIQPPFVYDFEIFASGCGLIAKNAVGILNERIFWMSQRHFFVLDANGVRALPCDVWDFLFRDLNPRRLAKITCAPNSNFSEIAWFFCSLSGGTEEIDSYVKLNISENTWDMGRLRRTAWEDQSVLGPPIGTDGPNGLLQQHETSPDADGNPMNGVQILTGYMDVGDGTEYMFLDRLIPDFIWTGSASPSQQKLNLTVYYTAFPGDPPVAEGPFEITSATRYVTIRGRARQIALGIGSNGLGVQWRLGAVRYRGSPDGRM